MYFIGGWISHYFLNMGISETVILHFSIVATRNVCAITGLKKTLLNYLDVTGWWSFQNHQYGKPEVAHVCHGQGRLLVCDVCSCSRDQDPNIHIPKSFTQQWNADYCCFDSPNEASNWDIKKIDILILRSV